MTDEYEEYVKRRHAEAEKKLEEVRKTEKERVERRKKAEATGRRLIVAGVCLLIIAGASLAGACIALTVGPAYDFNNAVHAHMENAYWAADPETMRSELLLAQDGMRGLGLTDAMYSKFWPWEKTPDNQMKWQYDHTGSVIIRCDEFIDWIAAQNGSQSQQLQDVYGQKLDNIRAFLYDGGWSDDIAKDAYYLKVCPLYVVYIPLAAGIIALLGAVGALSGLLRLMLNDSAGLN